MTRAGLATAVVIASACAGATAPAGTTVVDDALDSARTAVSRVTPTIEVAEPPVPDRSVFVGATRLINLWVGPGAETQTVDVWARRSMTRGSVQLASSIGFGTASPYFAVPPGQVIDIVGAGAGPDGLSLTTVVAAGAGEIRSVIFTNSDAAGSPTIVAVDEAGGDEVVRSSMSGRGVIELMATNVVAFGSGVERTMRDDSFFVGDGVRCTRAMGGTPVEFGFDQPVTFERPAGRSVVALHPTVLREGCDGSSTASFETAVADGGAVLVLLYTTDGTSLDVLQLPLG